MYTIIALGPRETDPSCEYLRSTKLWAWSKLWICELLKAEGWSKLWIPEFHKAMYETNPSCEYPSSSRLEAVPGWEYQTESSAPVQLFYHLFPVSIFWTIYNLIWISHFKASIITSQLKQLNSTISIKTFYLGFCKYCSNFRA